jgi:hypothetical protein
VAKQDRTARDLGRLAEICRALPEVEVATGQHTAFMVRGKKFAYHLVDHHGDGRIAFQCKAAPGENRALVASDPERFFLPPYMTQHGWVGLYLDRGRVDWQEVTELMTDAYLLIAPKRLARVVQGGPPA